MSDIFIERIENLIRVVANLSDRDFDIMRCPKCALGHAVKDDWFRAQGFKPNFATFAGITDFFNMSEDRVRHVFFWRPGYESRQDVLGALHVVLLEKMAQKIGATWSWWIDRRRTRPRCDRFRGDVDSVLGRRAVGSGTPGRIKTKE